VGLAARRRLRRVPTGGVLYLSGARCVASLPYLPDGERIVVTHLHAADREADPPLPPRQVERLLDATDVWVADDDATRDWAVREWGVTADAFAWTGPVTDLERWDRRAAETDPDALVLAVSGGTWFRRDHTARLVQVVRRLRPSVGIELIWTEVEKAEHLAPLIHDLDVLDVGDGLRIPEDHAALHDALRDADLLALTAPEDDAPWLAWDAATRGLPVVCFSTHPRAAEVAAMVQGRVVDYLDIEAMARAVVEIGVDGKVAALRDRARRRPQVAACDVHVFGAQLASAAEAAR
jgi:hypothetical protein